MRILIARLHCSERLPRPFEARLIYISGSRDDFFRHNFLSFKKCDDRAAIRYLESSPPTVDLSRSLSGAGANFEDDINRCISNLQRVGLNRCIVFDLSKPEIPIWVVRVVVPD